jgi:Peptidase family M23
LPTLVRGLGLGFMHNFSRAICGFAPLPVRRFSEWLGLGFACRPREVSMTVSIRDRGHGILRRIVTRALLLLIAVSAPTLAESIKLLPPLSPACISSPFGWRRALGPLSPAGMHNGIDIAAAPGTLVRAAAAGHVLKIDRMGIGGLQVIIENQGFTTLYAHLGTLVPPIAEGSRTIAAGEKIGFVGRSGLAYGVHLFFEVIVDGKPIDPAGFLSLPHC